eukprot:2645902-Karenia_brevis.AAC.1
MIGGLDPSRFPTLYEMKRHIYALGKLARLTVQQCRTMFNNPWLTSPQQSVNPQQGEGHYVALPVQSEGPKEETLMTPTPQRTPMVGLGTP